MSVSYEWDMEETDQHGDVIDHNFSRSLINSGFDHSMFYQKGYDLVLVRTDDLDRVWAYCSLVDGKLILPDCWNNGVKGSGDMPNWKVPKKFHEDLARWQK